MNQHNSLYYYAMTPHIDSTKFGVSFSIKQCRNFNLDPHDTLQWLLDQGWRRFRLMSYWDEHEPQPGQYNFDELNWQITAIAQVGGTISLCLGVKHPRWPEYHWPAWAWESDKQVRTTALLAYVKLVVTTFKSKTTIVSWQLENEALLRHFGDNIEIDRARLRSERKLLQETDPTRPVIMSTSNGWGIPIRAPHADKVGFSYYPIMYSDGGYHSGIQKPWLHRARKVIIEALFHTPVFLHELQCEPWGPSNIWDMSTQEQDVSMSCTQITRTISAARTINAYSIDLWGAEWWYWRHIHQDNTIQDAVTRAVYLQ